VTCIPGSVLLPVVPRPRQLVLPLLPLLVQLAPLALHLLVVLVARLPWARL